MKLQLRKAFVCLLVLGSALLLMGASTDGEPQAPVPSVSSASRVVWTPDGERIIFSRDFQGIFTVDTVGLQVRAVAGGAAKATPAFLDKALAALSADGTQIAYVTRLGGPSHGTSIAVAALDGTGVRRLTHSEQYNTHPEWSPDGTKIAFIADSMLSVVDVSKATQTRVLALSVNAVNAAPKWSPAGGHIAFVAVQDKPVHHYAVYKVRSDGSELTRLGSTVSVPSWSPDGKRIAFLMPEDGGEVSLYTLGSAGEDLQKVWSLGQARVFQVWSLVQTDSWFDVFSWSPDGSAILFASSAGEVVVVSLDIRAKGLFGRGIGGAFNALTVAPREFPGGVLARAAGRWAEWAPDGQKIGILTSLSHNGKIDTARQDELYTVSWFGALKRVLVRMDGKRLVAKHAGWYDVSRNVAACAEGFVVPNPDENQGVVQDCETLMAIRDRLSGDFLLNWSRETPISEWWGVEFFQVDPSRVGSLTLRGTGLIPHFTFISGAASQIPRYQGYDIGYDGLSGQIPPELGNLSGLRTLALSDNSLRGGIPPELGKLTNLVFLGLDGNSLAGSIPLELGNLSNLRLLILNDNDLSGVSPPELGNLTELDILYVQGNALTGCVPAVLAREGLMVKTDGLGFCVK